MARFFVTKYKEFSLTAPHVSSSWEIYRDSTKAELLYSTYNDTKWKTELLAAITDANGDPYFPDKDTYAIVKFEYGDGYETEWFELGPCCEEKGFVYDFELPLGEACINY